MVFLSDSRQTAGPHMCFNYEVYEMAPSRLSAASATLGAICDPPESNKFGVCLWIVGVCCQRTSKTQLLNSVNFEKRLYKLTIQANKWTKLGKSKKTNENKRKPMKTNENPRKRRGGAKHPRTKNLRNFSVVVLPRPSEDHFCIILRGAKHPRTKTWDTSNICVLSIASEDNFGMMFRGAKNLREQLE